MAVSASALPLLPRHPQTFPFQLCSNFLKLNTVVSSESFEKRLAFTCFSSKKKLTFMDQILDYIEGGPKLRKWYGAPDLASKDGSTLEEDEFQEESEVRDAVLVTDGDDEIGQMMILSLIIKRIRVKAVVRDRKAAMEAFGSYVEPIAGDPQDKKFVKKALKGVRAMICPKEGFLSYIDSWKGITHVILLSQLFVYKGTSGIQAVLKNSARKLAEQDESIISASGVPHTIIRAGALTNTPGGQQGFNFKEGGAAQGSLSKEDAAMICVEALDATPQKRLVFEVTNGEENVSDWNKCFESLMEKFDQ